MNGIVILLKLLKTLKTIQRLTFTKLLTAVSTGYRVVFVSVVFVLSKRLRTEEVLLTV
jgi:hypothetical protein